jgi:cobalt-precorrin-5B (C1)-methyltransferase
MEKYIEKDGKRLKLGYTTGSCAAAAAKAAGYMLLTGRRKEKIKIDTPKGIALELDVENIEMGQGYVTCSIKKDAGDDPDVTDGADVFAEVRLSGAPGISIDGGIGVGRVTKRGLDRPVGEAAINSVPRQMITEGIEEICEAVDFDITRSGISVVISVPGGERIAEKTFNSRLGIVGGISILGTTGIVEPMSEQALVDTIAVELRQRRENGAKYVLLTPGNYGSDYIRLGMELDPKWAVLTSNFIGDSLDICKRLGFSGALLVGHIGKLVKIAGGMMNTHSKYGDCRMEIMTSHAAAAGISPERADEMLDCATCDDAIRILKEESLDAEVLSRISDRIDFIMKSRIHSEMDTAAIFFSKEYGFLGKTKEADRLLELLIKQESGAVL